MEKEWMPNSAELLTLDYLSRKYDEVNAPLYISYPTLGHWKQTISTHDAASGIASCRNPFLYLHIPFCDNVCHYCMCYKVPAATKEVRKRYLAAMTHEIAMKAALMPDAAQRTITHLHIGGGTPTCLNEEELSMLLGAVAQHFTIAANTGGSFSIEAFPRKSDITRDKLRLLRQSGFNEISFGVQDFDNRVQKAINRSVTQDELLTCIELAKEEGFKVHVDLCYGLPFQELTSFEKTIRTIIDCAPDRVAMLTYIHFPVLYNNQRTIPPGALPNSFMRTLLWQCATTLFTDAGYGQIGIDHFVRTDDVLWKAFTENNVRRDLMGYSVGERKQVIGLGSSAISFVQSSYYHNAMTINEYCDAVENTALPLQYNNAYVLTPDDTIRSEIILRWLLTQCTLDTRAVGDTFGISFETCFRDELLLLNAFRDDGLVECDAGGRCTVTDRGRSFCRHIAAIFDRTYHHRSNH